MSRYARQQPMRFEVGKYYVTRGGDLARLFKRHHEFMVLIVQNPDATTPPTFCTCSCGFRFPDHTPHPLDLIREQS